MIVLFNLALILNGYLQTKYEGWNLRFNFDSTSRPGPFKKNPKGEDALFVNEVFMSLADGVGGWAQYGIDPSKFSNKLVENCLKMFD